MKPEISVIIPFYNVRKELFNNCIRSVLNQSFTDFELLIVNDGSEKSYSNELKNVELLDDRIRVINKENGGVSTARNRGVEEAKGEYITFIDADDVVFTYFLEQAYTIIKEASVDFVIGAMKSIHLIKQDDLLLSTNNNISTIHKYTVYTKENFPSLIPSLISTNRMIKFPDGSFINRGPCSRLLKTSIAKKCLFPVGITLGEDMIWNQIVLQNCNSLAVVESIWYLYFKNENSVSQKYTPNAIELIKDFHTALSEKVDSSNDKIAAALCSKYMEDIRFVICHNYLTSRKNKIGFFNKWKICNELKNQSPWNNINTKHLKLSNTREKFVYFLFKIGLLFPVTYLKDRFK